MPALTIAQGYPQNIVQRADDKGYEYDLQLYYEGAFDATLAEFPAIGDTETAWGLIENCYVLTRRFFVHPQTKGMVTYCDLHCGQEGNAEEDGWVTSFSDGGMQKPLEFHNDYRCKWNYHLAVKPGETPPSSYATAYTIEFSGTDGQKYIWIKEPSEAPVDQDAGKWTVPVGYSKTKPGVETYLVGSPIVREFIRCRSVGRANAQSGSRPVGSVFTRTANVNLADLKWLVTESGFSFDGAYWLATVTYQSSPYWDEDLYGIAQEQPS